VRRLSIVAAGQSVSGLLLVPDRPKACLVLAHGAGAGMTHPFMVAAAGELAARAIATLRYQFPYMERASRRPDPPAVAQATVRTAVATAQKELPRLPLFAGGKSFGGRMTSQAQAASPLAGVRGLVVLGFPLHPAGKPSVDRAEHLSAIRIPMLFLQGSRDALAEPQLLEQVVAHLGDRIIPARETHDVPATPSSWPGRVPGLVPGISRPSIMALAATDGWDKPGHDEGGYANDTTILSSGITLRLFPGADHSFHVRARSGRTDDQVRADVFDALADWISDCLKPPVAPVGLRDD
jgi:predicted alpha/beta-hydrolase family hydrolase